jgi:proteasome activator subunit 4
LCTTAFLVEISQHIKFGDMSTTSEDRSPDEPEAVNPSKGSKSLYFPSLDLEDINMDHDAAPRLPDKAEDALLKVRLRAFTHILWRDVELGWI